MAKLKKYTLDEIKDELIGPIGQAERDIFEFDLKMESLGEMIKKARTERNLTQEELGELVGVQKAQISKLEKSAKNVTITTIIRVFDALKAKVRFQVELMDQQMNLT